MADIQIKGLTVNPDPALTDKLGADNAADVSYYNTAKVLLELIHEADEKASLTANDEFGLIDSAASNVIKRVLWSTLLSNTSTFTNKFVTPRVTSITSSLTPTPNADTTDMYIVTALAGDPTFGAPTGTPVQGQKLTIRIKDNATGRTVSWNGIYRAIGTTLPASTTASKTVYVGFIYNSTDTKWDCVAVQTQA
jgi:hypothetical protein